MTLRLVHSRARSDLFTITQAKRLYGFIGTGSVLGAIVGSGAAGLLSRVVAPERLLVVSALGFGVAGLMPALYGPRAITGRRTDASPELLDTIAYVRRDGYASRIAASLLLATVCLTLADYVFKSTVAALVPRRSSAPSWGRCIQTNILSLVSQIALVDGC